MTIAATAVWRVRAGGNALNGAGYDPAITGGTDYSQQDAAQLTGSTFSTSAANSTTLIGTGFTSAMVGNAFNLASGTNAIPGFYFIVSYTSSTAIVLDRAPATAGALSGGVGRIGGALQNAALNTGSILDPGSATGAKAVAGNTVYIRGAGTDSPSAADYTNSGYLNGAGGTSSGTIKIRGENGRPRIDGTLIFHNSAYLDVQGCWFHLSGTGYSNLGMINGYNCVVKDNVFDQAGSDMALIGGIGKGVVINNECFSSVTAAVGSQYAIAAASFGSLIAFNNVHDCIGPGIISSASIATIKGNLVINCGGNGMDLAGSGNGLSVIENTLSGNGGHGMTIDDVSLVYAVNNLICNHTGSGKYGMLVSGTTATNDRLKLFIDGNTFYNNTTHQNGISAGAYDVILATDPFVASGTENYTLTSANAGTAPYPTGPFKQHLSGKTTTVRSYLDPGAVQRQEPAAGLNLTQAEVYSVS